MKKKSARTYNDKYKENEGPRQAFVTIRLGFSVNSKELQLSLTHSFLLKLKVLQFFKEILFYFL